MDEGTIDEDKENGQTSVIVREGDREGEDDVDVEDDTLRRDTRAIATACVQAVSHLADAQFESKDTVNDGQRITRNVEDEMNALKKKLHLQDGAIDNILRRRCDLGAYDQVVQDIKRASTYTMLVKNEAHKYESVQKACLSEAREKLREAGGGENKATEFLSDFVNRSLEKLRPTPASEIRELAEDARKVLEARETAEQNMMQNLSREEYRKARDEEQKIIAYDSAALRLNRLLRESLIQYHIERAEISKASGETYLNRWKASLSAPKRAANEDMMTLNSYRASLKTYEDNQKSMSKKRTDECKVKLAILEKRRVENFDLLVDALSREHKRVVEERNLLKEMDNLRFRDEIVEEMSGRLRRSVDRSEAYRKQLVAKMDSGVHAIKSLRRLHQKQHDVLKLCEDEIDPEEISKFHALLKSHYDLTRQSLSVLLAKSERLKRRVAVLEAKEAEYTFEISHAFETEMPQSEVEQMKQLKEKCKRNIALASQQREEYDAAVKAICDDDFQNTMSILKRREKCGDPMVDLVGTLAADESAYVQQLQKHHKSQEELTKKLLTPAGTRSRQVSDESHKTWNGIDDAVALENGNKVAEEGKVP